MTDRVKTFGFYLGWFVVAQGITLALGLVAVGVGLLLR